MLLMHDVSYKQSGRAAQLPLAPLATTYLVEPVRLLDQEQQAFKRPEYRIYSQLTEQQAAALFVFSTHSSSSAGTFRINLVHKSSSSSVLGCKLAVIVWSEVTSQRASSVKSRKSHTQLAHVTQLTQFSRCKNELCET